MLPRSWKIRALQRLTSVDHIIRPVNVSFLDIMPPKRLLEQVRDALRRQHYSYRTEKSYLDWIKRYIFFHNKRHPSEMGTTEVEAFLNHLAIDRTVAASTQNQV